MVGIIKKHINRPSGLRGWVTFNIALASSGLTEILRVRGGKETHGFPYPFRVFNGLAQQPKTLLTQAPRDARVEKPIPTTPEYA